MNGEEEYLTVAETAKTLRVSDRLVRGLIASGELDAHRIGHHERGQLRIPKGALQAYLNNHKAAQR